MSERDYYLGFSVFPGVGPKRFSDLIAKFGSAKNAWHATEEALLPVLGNAFGSAFLSFRETFSLTLYKERLEKKQVAYIALVDSDYPKLLKEIPRAPIVLYLRGNRNILTVEGLDIGIVGTRKITSYGKHVTQMITEELVFAKCRIISGLALGVDAVAHATTLALGGTTIAVLGSGVDVCHPSSNRKIYEEIIAGNGAVVSEYPIEELPSKGSFPSRNRIIAGLSRGVVVTEGASDSGALITAEDAFRFGRTVYAVPGPITSSLSKGPNSLLARGAKLVTSGKDIIDDLGITSTKRTTITKNITGDTDEEQKIIDMLGVEQLHFDEIVRRTEFPSNKAGMLLSLLEIKGIILQQEGFYRLNT